MDEYIDYNWCPRCGEMRGVCTCTDDEIDAWQWYEEDENAWACMCPFCPCGNTVSVPGEICGECWAGAHQG